MVQLAVLTPIRGCTKYHAFMARCVVVWYVNYANRLNRENTATTWIQYYLYSREVKIGFLRRKKELTWDSGSMAQTKLNDKEFEYADSCYSGEWQNYTSWEVCQSLYDKSQKVAIPSTE